MPWSPTAEKQDQRDAQGNLFFEQVWFPGVHADIGGGIWRTKPGSPTWL
ncbi:DUF2235 domain-containing protein [Bradyrhizobium sp. JR4.1]